MSTSTSKSKLPLICEWPSIYENQNPWSWPVEGATRSRPYNDQWYEDVRKDLIDINTKDNECLESPHVQFNIREFFKHAFTNSDNAAREINRKIFTEKLIWKGDYFTAEMALMLEGVVDLVELSHTERSYEIIRNLTPENPEWPEVVNNAFIEDIYLRASLSNDPILIVGETGTGKQAMARCIHMISNRRDKPFKEINCAAFPDTLIEDELFGHKKGSFTGAYEDKEGLLKSAHGGTVFLDEIAKMKKPQQAKLLKVMDAGNFRPIGGIDDEKTNVRFVAAIHPGNEDKLLPDLKYRLGYPDFLELWPLHKRLSKYKGLARSFINNSIKRLQADKNSYIAKYNINIDNGAVEALEKHDYPGNYRELESILRMAIRNAMKKPKAIKRVTDEFTKEELTITIKKKHLSFLSIPKSESTVDISLWSLMDLIEPDNPNGKLAPIIKARAIEIKKSGKPLINRFSENKDYQKFLDVFERITGNKWSRFTSEHI